jgi:hypothetical protein
VRPAQRLEHAVAPSLVRRGALRHALLRPRQRRERRLLHRTEDADAAVVVEQVDALDDLGVADDEADAPARHPVALRHREHLDAELLRAARREEAPRRAAVEDEVAVGEVVHDRGVGLAREREGVLERAGRRRDRTRVRRVVEVERGDVLARRAREVWAPAVLAVERHVPDPRACERRA